MKGSLTGAKRHPSPRLAKRLVFDDEYMMTEEEIGAVFERWRKMAADDQNGFGGIEPYGEDEDPGDARFFLDVLAQIRCERIGL